jgi:hypothetical protein
MHPEHLKAIINEEVVKFLAESSLSRMQYWLDKHECALISANRNNPKDTSKCRNGFQDSYADDDKLTTRDINKLRTRDLKALLLRQGYGVTAVDGSYVENYLPPDQEPPPDHPEPKEVKEDSFLVVNLKDKSDFEQKIRELGEIFCQDSVLVVDRGGDNARLIGTNNGDFPGYGNTVVQGSFYGGRTGEFMTRVRNRPSVFKENLQTYQDLSRLERMAVTAIAKKYIL